jgi:large subunit ribosomal protein L4
MKLDVLKLDGGKAGSVELDETIFGLTPRSDVLHRMVRWQQAKRRAGTHSTQDRGDVSVTHSKSVKQKGSGGARHGAKNAPIFRGGGVAHGPHPRSHAHDLTKKFRALGLKMALSAKAQAGTLVILDSATMATPKTQVLKANFAKLGFENALIVGGAEIDGNFKLAARNIMNIDVLPSVGINVEMVLKRKKLVLTKDAVEALNARFAVGAPAKAAPKATKAAKAEEVAQVVVETAAPKAAKPKAQKAAETETKAAKPKAAPKAKKDKES